MARLLLSTLMLIVFGSMVSAQGSYKIQSGDVLIIEVLEDATLNRNALVLPDGTVTVPLVGSVVAAGSTINMVQAAIVSGLTPNFASAPNVFVSIQSIIAPSVVGTSTFHVFIIGAVANPGRAEVAPGTTLLQFLAESGGFTRFAAKKRIQLRRAHSKSGQSMIINFNFRAIENGQASVNSVVLHSGDVIIVPERRLFE